jgi:hypothetical protein
MEKKLHILFWLLLQCCLKSTFTIYTSNFVVTVFYGLQMKMFGVVILVPTRKCVAKMCFYFTNNML